MSQRDENALFCISTLPFSNPSWSTDWDLKMRLLAPPEIQNYISDNESFSTSGHASKGEGGDFVLENRNKRIKSLIPKGVPTEDVWLQACRSFDTLDKVSYFN